MNGIPFTKLHYGGDGGDGGGIDETDIRMHPQFAYFKSFYEKQVKELRTTRSADATTKEDVPQITELERIQKRGVVRRNPALVKEDEYLLQQYKHPRVKPDLKLHGMIDQKVFAPRAFRESDIPQLNPYALVNDEGSGYEVGKLYAYDRKSF